MRAARLVSFSARIRAGRAIATSSSSEAPLAARFSAFSVSQAAVCSSAVRSIFVAEHVRMALDHLVGERLGDVGEIERALLLGHAGVEGDLEEEVAEFFLERRHVAALDRVGDLVGFLDRVRRDGREILLDIPRAAVLAVAAAAPSHRARPGWRRRCGRGFCASFLSPFQ